MFNTKQFNLSRFDTINSSIVWAPSGDVIYGDFVLHQTQFISLGSANYNNGPSVEDNTYARPDTDWMGLNSYFLRAKTVALSGHIRASSRQGLEEMMNTMLQKISVPNQYLQVYNAGTYFRAPAYCINLDSIFNRAHYHNTFIPFNLVFQVNAPFWESVTVESITYTVSGTLQEEIINVGSAYALPVISISFISASGTNSIDLTFGDYVLNISETIAASDIVRVDSETKQVFLNGVEIDYTGRIPILETWVNPFTIDANGAFSADISINYRNKYI